MSEITIPKVGRLSLNRGQLHFAMYLHMIRRANVIAGRGFGKSCLIWWLMIKIVREMPRSCWVLQGKNFQQILTRTLPGTLSFAEKLGYRNGLDYFINTFPPKTYARPFECPLKPDNCLFVVDHTNMSCVAFPFFSQDGTSSSRGPNRDGVIADESLLLDIDKFNEEALATNRGNDTYFGKHKFHHGIFHFTSMPTGESWLFDLDEYYKKDKNNFLVTQNKIIDLQLEYARNRERSSRIELWREIYELNKLINFYPSNKGDYYVEYSAFDNITNLGVRYIDDLYDSMTEGLFCVEVLNKRVTQIENSFYPKLDRSIHTYTGHFDDSYLQSLDIDFVNFDRKSLTSLQDKDCNTNQPLDIGLDFGTAINWLIVGQPSTDRKQYTFLKNFYVKSPKNIDDVVKEFCEYYKHHNKKLIYLYPDGEGNVKRANVRHQQTYVEQISKIFYQYGWSVSNEKPIQYNTAHKDTFLTWARCLGNGEKEDSIYPKIRINSVNCKELIYSMEQTPAIDHGRNDIRKDKTSEKRLIGNREQATDAGDAADQIIQTKFGGNRIGGFSSNLPAMS